MKSELLVNFTYIKDFLNIPNFIPNVRYNNVGNKCEVNDYEYQRKSS
jgi:hypothetical protein